MPGLTRAGAWKTRDGIDAGLRHRAMGSTSEQANLQTVRRRGDGTGASGNRAGGSEHDVLAENDGRFREALEQAVIDHRLGALRRLFPGLEDHHQGPLPGVPRQRKQVGRACEPGHVHVVAAHVTDRHRLAVRIGRLDLARVDDEALVLMNTAAILDDQGQRIRWPIQARSMTVGPSPLRSNPTTPVLPMPVVTS